MLLCGGPALHAQVIPEPVIDESIYLFIDELAGEGVIDLNRAVKPYSKKTIIGKLDEADQQRDRLSLRQQKELDFWRVAYGYPAETGKMKLRFNPAAAQYRDSLFSVTISPIFGVTFGKTNGAEDQNILVWKNGAKAYGSYKNWAFFASLQDNHETPMLGAPEFLTMDRGGLVKYKTDFSEMTGGASYMWKWGHVSFLKDAPVWGSGYAGTNIFSGRAPSYMQIRLNIKPVKWAEMTWMYGWLTSMVIDSTRSYWQTNAYGTEYRDVYHRKYISANIFTFTPFQRLHVSLGNSIIWSDPRLTPHFVMPFFFYKSVDHNVNADIGNSNSQMFIDISSNNIRHLHLYGTLFIDEMSTKRFTTPQLNFFSWKGGFRAGNFSFLPNLYAMAEFTFTFPLTFQHAVTVTTFENQGYNMGHWLRDNSRSVFMALDYRPVRTMTVRLWHEWSERGADNQNLGGARVGLPYLDHIEWTNSATGLDVSYLITGGVQVRTEVTRRNVTGRDDWYPLHLFGKTTTVTGGVVWGF